MKKPTIVHPVLLAISPVLFLFSHNIDKLSLIDIVVPIVIVASTASLLWFTMIFIAKDKYKAGLIVSVFFTLFYISGVLLNKIQGMTNGMGKDLLQIITALTSITLLTLTIYSIRKISGNLPNLTKFLNIFTASAVLIPLVMSVSSFALQDHVKFEKQTSDFAAKELEKHPDIYYIILDGYARADILKELFNYDNSQFLTQLAQKGFYIADSSRTNYCQTVLSISSSLNFNYLYDLINQLVTQSTNKKPLMEIIQNNRTAKILKQYGYEFVAFSTGYSLTEIRNADNYISPGLALDEFQNVLLNITPLPVLGKWLSPSTGGFQYEWHRNRILHGFEHLADYTKTATPVFVMAHFMSPHPPFVFGENGEPITPNRSFSFSDGSHFMAKAKGNRDEYLENYRKQLCFINKKVLAAIDDILSKSTEPPIIILQSDHGAGSIYDQENIENTYLKERMSILNAYYFPLVEVELLYKEITPVNTFRVILNQYFGANFELLPDRSFYSSRSKPFEFIDVTGELH